MSTAASSKTRVKAAFTADSTRGKDDPDEPKGFINQPLDITPKRDAIQVCRITCYP